MLKLLLARARHGTRTARFPVRHPPLPERFGGRPAVDPERCEAGCEACLEACPTAAVTRAEAGPAIDLGRCLFCDACARACSGGAIEFRRQHRLAATSRASLQIRGAEEPEVHALAEDLRRLMGRSLRLRQVSAAGCNGCEAEVNALGNVVFDSGRFGIEFVASPRHADGILVTGPVGANMRDALLATYEAVPDPRVVIAAGACAISGGPYAGHHETHDGCEALVPVDLYVPGCPPHPYTLLDALLRFLGRSD